MSHKTISLLGYGSDIAGANRGSGEGSVVLKKSSYASLLTQRGVDIQWEGMLQPDLHLPSKLRIVERLSQELSLLTTHCVLEKKFFTVIGGDHTAAIGTWSGVHQAKQAEGPIGLIWVDAHLDSHTPHTSESGNLHGMPLACLLGYGEPRLTHLMRVGSKLKAEHICVIGVRSFEPEERDLLNQLNVRIFFMDEVKQRGMLVVMQEAIHIVTHATSCYGISIDLDSIDPSDAPGTGVAEPDGIPGDQLCEALRLLRDDPRLVGAEIVEFDPGRDQDHITEKLIWRLLAAMTI